MSEQSTHKKINAVVLAGGQGSRMGSRDKGLVPFKGKPLIAWVIAALRPQVSTLAINCNRNHQRYQRFGLHTFCDTIGGQPGPLAGVLAAFDALPDGYLLTVPCDTPLLPADLVVRLLAQLRSGYSAATVSDGTRTHPVIALYRPELRADLSEYLTHGGRRVHDWLTRLHYGVADFSDCPEAFRNINSAQELLTLEQETVDESR